MRKIHLLTLLAFSCVTIAPAIPALAAFGKKPQAAAMEDRPDSFADLVAPLLPAVVNISSTQKAVAAQDFPEMPQFPEGSPFEDFFEQFMDKNGQFAPSTPATSLGSGFVIDAKNGYIVTNNHVVRDADEVRVTFSDDSTVSAKIIGTDEKTDLAVLKEIGRASCRERVS
jgi:serine protease Do